MSLERPAFDHILGKDLDPTIRVVLERLIEAIQANFDHLSGEAIGNTKVFNLFVDQLQEAFDQLIADVTAEMAEHGHTAEEVAEGDATAIDHTDLGNVTANQHHNQSHTQADHDVAEAGDLAAVAAAAAAGSSTEVPNADHVHPHGTGYAGAHSDAVNDGDAAGGDLSGTYPNPSVVDDSHSHGAGTAPGGAHDHTTGDGYGVLTNDEHDGYSEYVEIATPSTPASNKGRLYLKDNGSGKTQLVVIFSGGAEIVLAVDP